MNATVQVAPDLNTSLDIEAVKVDKDLMRKIELEKFMNDIVEVYVYPSTNESDVPHFILNVNGVNQPVFRGNVTPMKRCFLEVLARMKETRHSQGAMNYQNPEASNALIPRTGQVYPFEVRKDPSPVGGAWLARILQEKA